MCASIPMGPQEEALMPTMPRRSRATNGHAPLSYDTMQRVEALSVGAVEVVTGTVVSAIRGIQEIGAEVGSTAVSAVRGSIRAVEVIGGDLGRVARNVMDGAVTGSRDVRGDVIRIARDAADGAREAVDRIGSATLRMVRGVVDETASRASSRGRKALRRTGPRSTVRAPRSPRRAA